MVFTFAREEEITGEVVREFIDQHQLLVPKYLESKNMYEGNHQILSREAREAYKPDNRLVVNFAKYIVDTFNGYFIGIPIKLTHDNDVVHENILTFAKRSNLADSEAELAKMASIYGHAFEYIYQDEETNTKVIYNSPIDMFVVYDDTIAQEPLFAVRYQYDEDGKLTGELIDDGYRYKLTGSKNDKVIISDAAPHYYGGVPVIEYIENEERQSIFENVKSLINALNTSLSQKADDVDYFADAYLKVIGAELDEETMTELRANRTINLVGDGANDVTIEFLTKPNADQTQENLIDRLINLIFQVAMVANINDDSFGSASSGVALEFKLQPMKNLAIMKERKFRNSMQDRFKLYFNLPTNMQPSLKDEWLNIEYLFSRNIPHNIADEAETASKLEGIVSKETQLSVLSIVDDSKTEIERMDKESIPVSLSDEELSTRFGR